MSANATTDATMQLIRDLEDPTKYEKVERVSVFKPHVRELPAERLPDGRIRPARTITVRPLDMIEIARNVNTAYRRDGELVRLTIGHRLQHPLADERDQPVVVGFARNYLAEPVERPDGQVFRLTHTEYIKRQYATEASGLPGRSPEYDADAKTITAVALLTRDPFLTLGTVAYHRTPDAPTYPNVVSYMRDHPGTTYTDALVSVSARYDGGRRSEVPTPHERTLDYMRLHPGTPYADAWVAVLRGR